MADNVAITAGTGTIIAADEVVDATLGTAKVQYIKLMDGNLNSTAKATVATVAQTMSAGYMLVALASDSVNANGLAVPANSAPVVIAPQTLDVAVTPTVTASAYTANNVIGGVMTFASILPSIGNNGILQSITAKFKATAVTGNINVAVFKANPSNGTYTDKTAATWNSADMANLLGIYQLTTPLAIGAATMTVYCLDGIGKAFVGSSTSLYVVATVAGTPTPASTSDFTLELAVLPG
jgi:hypothetical protein